MATKIIVNDAVTGLQGLESESVHCVVTSPPYWGMREYGGDPGMIGMEQTFDEHLENLLAVFAEVHRVLRSDGVVWLNYGDAYAGAGYGNNPTQKERKPRTTRKDPRFKPKELMFLPVRIAIALSEAQGWYPRCEVIWHKKNAIPDTAPDRPANTHEKVIQLTKTDRNYYDQIPVRTPRKAESIARDFRAYKVNPNTPKGSRAQGLESRQRDNERPAGIEKHLDFGANLKNVWHLASANYEGAHFAVMPEEMVELCISSSSSEKGVCSACGKPFERFTHKFPPGTTW